MSIPHRLQVKLFFDSSTDLPMKSFIPVFHTWIQKQETGDLLIDVHNYSHMHHGPGILLVAHESDFAIDLADGKTGLIYRRKRNFNGSLKGLLELTLQRLVSSAIRLEQDDSLAGKVRFRTDEAEIRFLDRLAYPNKPEVYDTVEPDLSAVINNVFGDGNATLEQIDNDPREPLSVRIRLSKAPALDDLASRLEAGEYQPK